MFKPVTGQELDNFDEETRDLYAKRSQDEKTSYILRVMPRKQRNHLPVIVDENNKYLQELQKANYNFPWKMLMLFGAFSVACTQYQKSYYPYGIIARRSVPISAQSKVMFYAPAGLLVTYLWWTQKEKPRSQRCDFTSDAEL